MTTARGCTEAEAMTAAAMAADLMRRHGLAEGDIEMGTAAAPQKTSRPTIRDYLYGTIARCTNTAAIVGNVSGIRQMTFVGRAPGPEIAAYLKTVCDRAIDRAVQGFKHTQFYRSRRTISTKRRAIAEFTQTMVARIQIRLQELFEDIISEQAVQAARNHLAVLYPHTSDRKAANIVKARYWDAKMMGWEAGGDVTLHHGVGSQGATLAIGGS